jgi:hypothetical protein
MRVYPEKIKKVKKKLKKREGHAPLNLPQRWNEFNNSPPRRGVVLRRGGSLSFILGYPEKKIKNTKK